VQVEAPQLVGRVLRQHIWASVNERNAIVVVTRQRVVELFRNPVNAAVRSTRADRSARGARSRVSISHCAFPGCRCRWTGSGVVLTALGASRP
jgi:hypothetical protein